MARSNGFPFQIIDVAPLLDVGFEVRVIHRDDWMKLCKGNDTAMPIAVIARFVTVQVQTELCGTGSGSVTLDLDDEMWDQTLANGQSTHTLKEYEHLWQVWENGAWRGSFLAAAVTEQILDSRRTITISGPGPAEVLTWGVVMTPWYPNAAPTDPTTKNPYQFKPTEWSHMGAWRYLLEEAQKRGTVPFVCTNFNGKFDSGGEAWDDTPPPPTDPSLITTILSADLNFFPDDYTLTDYAASQLNGLIPYFDDLPVPHLVIVGHTDSTNTVAYNQTLSERRAQSVAAFIRAQVPHAVMSVSGRGELQPVDTNNTAIGREHNRRVVLTYPVESLVASTFFAAPAGGNLLELLNNWTGQDLNAPSDLRAEWYMAPNFSLHVRRQFGVHRENQVVFYEGSTTMLTRSRERRRADIRNLIAVQNSTLGDYSVAVDQESVSRWHQREYWEKQADGFGATGRATIAELKLAQAKDEQSTWSMTVPPYAEGRRVYEDYQLGDWVGVSRYQGAAQDEIDPFRVKSITIQVNADNTVTVELGLQNRQEFTLDKLKARLEYFIKHKKDLAVYIQDEEPVLANVGDLWTPKRITGPG